MTQKKSPPAQTTNRSTTSAIISPATTHTPMRNHHGLTTLQARFVEEYTNHGYTPAEAARQAGYKKAKHGKALLELPAIRAAIRHHHARVIQTEGRTEALATLRQIMRDTDASPSARVAAAKIILERAEAIDAIERSNVHEEKLSGIATETLRALIDKGTEILRAPIIDVDLRDSVEAVDKAETPAKSME